MDIIDRLNVFFKSTGLPPTRLADELGIPRPSFSQILNGRNKKISNEILSKIHSRFPGLNISWLLFGEGTMEKGYEPSDEKPESTANDFVFVTDVPQYGKSSPEEKKTIPVNKEEEEEEEKRPSANRVAKVIFLFTDGTYEVLKP